ncbi:MAG: pesticidal protein Cry15Aa [Chloroflexi bacterium]|nr:pesticidal protein Cry15Aa [Chloroflexota bacterium]MBK6710119.1 pesticidal protein Cry15Aa [Chloroflexota bacterium]MBK7178562.1 pesticidal protein Cry15Aa [Chloroflexota bacterium]MBK8933511.1 pesticidal protein Cry15Aa [Chloroflexota bacterium]MBP6805479.1 pesticidal protein Cry15Aa [Chloroflexota bacterium]
MPVIKRYPNRKLYDTEAKKYITLDGIAELIRKGEDIQVVDHTTDEDLTAVTLTQIIFEQEKKSSGFLPTSVLTGLVQAGGQTVNTLRRSLTSPLELLNHVDQEIDKRLQSLTERGDLAKDEATRLREKLLSDPARMAEEKLNATASEIEKIVRSRGIPTRDEVQTLITQLDDLAGKIAAITVQEQENHPDQGSA